MKTKKKEGSAKKVLIRGATGWAKGVLFEFLIIVAFIGRLSAGSVFLMLAISGILWSINAVFFEKNKSDDAAEKKAKKKAKKKVKNEIYV